MNTGFDTDILLGELDFLKGTDFDTELTGFDMAEIEKLFAENDKSEVKDDDFDLDKAVAEPPFTMLGDLWTLGRHRLLVGDSTKAEDVARLMDGNKIHLYLSDPPYAISYSAKAGTIKNDDLRGDEFHDKLLLPSFKNAFEYLYEGGWGFIFHASTTSEYFLKAYRLAGYKLSGICQWVKQSLVLGRSPFQFQNEPCLAGFKEGKPHYWFLPPNEARKQTTVWNFDKPHKNENHPTCKPLPLLGHIINIVTAPEMTVYDSFLGSGSTLIACEQMNRRCLGIELDEKYASVIVKRYVETVGSAEWVTVERNGEILKYSEVVKSV
ncbi:hypothetical protein FACS1894188_08090 [Clostridia bacterium]|nr:hypothetical protein FACS1894188_08090 [Clostridia bacterium]